MIRKLFAFFWLLSGMVLAQNTVTGTIIDPNGNPYANGTASASSVVASGQPSTATTPVPTNGAGFFSLSLPSATYIFTLCAPPVVLGPTVNPTPKQVCFSSGPVAISGNVDISTQLNAAAAVLGPKSGITGLPTTTAGSVLASQGIGISPVFQTKTMIDVRDSAVNFDCTGTNAMDTGMQSISSTAHVIIPIGCIVRLSSAHTYPQSFEFARGGQLRPDTGILITLTGPIIAGSVQIFANSLATQGGIDFTGNVNTFDVLPEWWGASTTATAATNTTAIQAAIYGAFGCNVSPVTVCRTNAAATSFYNKRLYLAGKYQIAGELHWYHTLNFIVQGMGRLLSGIIQTTTNSRIIDGQSNAYGVFKDLSFSSTVSQDLNHPLADFNFDGSQGSDLAPQFLDFFNINWSGNSVTAIGWRVAAAGGGAQGSDINFYNNFATSFTEAAYMIGSGSACVPTNVATNAIGINWFGADIQNSPAFGIENHGGTQLHYLDGTMENGGFIALGQPAQTGGDFCANNMNAGGGPFVVENYRSESTKMFSSVGGLGANFSVINAITLDQVSVPLPGGTGTVGQLIQGDPACNHGLYEKVSVGGTFSGLGTAGSPLHAASGTATTIVDNTGGFTVNAWTGWDVCIVSGTGSTPAQYCVITSNTATTFTCTAGWQSDYSAANAVTILPNPDNTTLYKIEPNWGTQTTDGGVTFGVDNTTYSGLLAINGAFFPGKRIAVGNDVGNFNNLQVTRSDWASTGSFLDQSAVPLFANVIAGSPITAGGGVAGINLTTSLFVRPYALPRNSVSELPLPFKQEVGTRALHWFSGVSTGGLSAADVYIGSDPNIASAGQGDLFIENNSANTGKKWTFNFDGSLTVPVGGGTAATAGTGIFSSGAGNMSFAVAGGNPMQLSTNDVNITQRHLIFQVSRGQHINTNAAGNDISGTCTAAAATTCTVTFTTSYGSAPSCTVTDQTNITTLKALPSATNLVITTSAASSDTFSYLCIGNPN